MKIQGTLKELASKVTFNGQKVTLPQLSILTTLGKGVIAHEVGKAPKPDGQRGRAASIWELDTDATTGFAALAAGAAVVADAGTDSEGDNTPESE